MFKIPVTNLIKSIYVTFKMINETFQKSVLILITKTLKC